MRKGKQLAMAGPEVPPESEGRKKRPYSAPNLVAHGTGKFPRVPLTAAKTEAPDAGQASISMQAPDACRQENIADEGHTLYQEVFFFCAVPNVGDLAGTGFIYVETVVDRDSGFAFAKVYPAKSSMNAVEILSTRVFPFLKSKGLTVQKIHTPKRSEYFGLAPLHPYETLLAASHIQHLPADNPGTPHNYLCLQFYRFLQKEFFRPALRKKFNLSLEELQQELDEFIDAYNGPRSNHSDDATATAFRPAKFPFEL